MPTKKTSFNVTRSLVNMIDVLIKELDIPRTSFHRKAIKYFLEGSKEINSRLLITQRSNPEYVMKDATEQIYLPEEYCKKLDEVKLELSEKYKTDIKVGTILFQALMDYCAVLAPVVLEGKSNGSES